MTSRWRTSAIGSPSVRDLAHQPFTATPNAADLAVLTYRRGARPQGSRHMANPRLRRDWATCGGVEQPPGRTRGQAWTEVVPPSDVGSTAQILLRGLTRLAAAGAPHRWEPRWTHGPGGEVAHPPRG